MGFCCCLWCSVWPLLIQPTWYHSCWTNFTFSRLLPLTYWVRYNFWCWMKYLFQWWSVYLFLSFFFFLLLLRDDVSLQIYKFQLLNFETSTSTAVDIYTKIFITHILHENTHHLISNIWPWWEFDTTLGSFNQISQLNFVDLLNIKAHFSVFWQKIG